MNWQGFLGVLAAASVTLAVSTASAAPASPVGPALPPPAAFLHEATASDPMISPDGITLVARFEGASPALCVVSVAKLNDGCARNIKVAGRPSLSWLGNDRLLSFKGFSVVVGPSILFVSLFEVINLKTGEITALLPEKSPYDARQAVWIAPDGSSVLLTAQRKGQSWPAVIRYDLKSQAVTEVQPPQSPVILWFADPQGAVRSGIGYDSRGPAILYRDKPGDPLVRAPKPPKPKAGADGDDIIESIRYDGPDGKKLAVSNRKTGRFAVYEYDPAQDALGPALFEHPKADIEGLMLDPSTQTVAGITYEDDRPRVKWLQPEIAKLQAQVDKIFPDSANSIVSRSRDGNLVVVKTSSPNSPGVSYLFNRKERRMDGLVAAFADREKLPLSPVRTYEYQSRDGLAISGYLTLPQGKAAHALPLIVMPHGGPFARDHWGYDPYVQFLASRGYAVLQPQFRGSTGFGRAFVEKGYGQWGAAMQDDLLDGIAALTRDGTADPKRVCIMGISYGGYAAEWAAARDAAHYRCAISLAGVSDLRAQIRHDRSQFYAARYAAEWSKKIQGEEKRDLAAFSPLQQQAAISIPLLIAHGEADANVLARQSHQLVKALQKRQATVEAYFYEGEGHGLSEAKNGADFLTHVEAFLARYNPA